eukprot:TRINITY_DN1684_c0_g4_i1.p1 TRINITY_DN1684_c0_g4~~TRINITY_DN1684_c0_g4_i1.p1  ORF type:complete len:352 (+),score=16.16 TRINITY_DN1684_c0_g4_i1:145-1200(+)
MSSKSDADLVFHILELICFVFGTSANLVLICAFVNRFQKKSTANSAISHSTYLVMFHISVDFCWSLCSLIVVGYSLSRETFSDSLCKTFGFINHFVVGISMVFMVIMAFERYLTIVRGPGTATVNILVSLTIACILMCLVYATLPLVGVGMYADHGTTYTCFANKSPDFTIDPFLILSMSVVFNCASLISILFYLIFRHVKAVTSAVASSTRGSALKVEVEVAKSFLFSVCFFLFAWAPVAILWLLQLASIYYSQALVYVAVLNGAFYPLGNPILYVVFNLNVRRMVLDILPAGVTEWLERRAKEAASEVSAVPVSTPRSSATPILTTLASPSSVSMMGPPKNDHDVAVGD